MACEVTVDIKVFQGIFTDFETWWALFRNQ